MMVWIAMLLWPVISFIFYRKMSLPAALCATILGGELLLPVFTLVDPPVLPPLNKTTIPVFSALVLTAVAIRNAPATTPVLPGWIPRSPVILGLLCMFVVGTFATVATNRDVLVFGERVLQGHQFYDAFSILLETFVMLAPLFIARRVLSSPEGQRALLVALVVGAVAYSFPMLYELRMSPQLNLMIYGFFPHQFAQHMRDGGFRPVVFFNHGLALSLFITFAIIAAAGLLRATTGERRWKWLWAMIWLFVILVLSKSLGPLLIALALVPALLFLNLRAQLLAAVCIAGIVMTYPVLRAAGLVPVDEIMAFAQDISAERASSFNTRIESEEILLERAKERPLFGWGVWGRQRVFDEYGRDLSITDGSWVIELGAGGWFRYIPIFGLMCWPIIGLFIGRRTKIDQICLTLVLILSAKLVDLIPNSGVPPMVWLVVGALVGRLEKKPAVVAQAPQKPAYTRSMASLDAVKPAPRPGYTRGLSGQDDTPEPPETAVRERKSGSDSLYRRPKSTLRLRR